jgi:hypothetical protein
MKAAIFDNSGLENLRVIDNVKEPQLTDHHDVLMRQIFICKSIRKALENVLNVIYKLRLFNRSEVEEE